MRYVLIRHGESKQNVGAAEGMIDATIPLTNDGFNQALKLSQYIRDHRKILKITNGTALFFSPYLRAIQTKNEILLKNDCITDSFEEICLTEIQCGDFTGYTMKQYRKINPIEYEKYKFFKNNKSRWHPSFLLYTLSRKK